MYSFNARVRYSEVGGDCRLSLPGIVNYLQDCSTFQSEDLKMGIEYLEQSKRAWWLSSWQIVIERYPQLGEEIVVSTWPFTVAACWQRFSRCFWQDIFVESLIGDDTFCYKT